MFAVAFAGVVSFAAAAAGADVSNYEKTLAEAGVSPDGPGIAAYLQRLHPTPEQRQEALRFIEELGNSSFAEREQAMQQLLLMPVLDTEAIAKATEASDPEVRWRAQKVLAVGRPQTERLLYASFKVVEEKKHPETVQLVIDAIPLCDKKHIRDAAHMALVSAAKAEDVGKLVKASQSEAEHVRAAAAAALGASQGKDVHDQLAALTADESDLVRLAAARAMANYGERGSLNVLVDLLDAEDVEVRTHSSSVLRSLTDQFFGYAAYDKPENRSKSVKQWSDWVAAKGETAELKFPLKPWGYGVSFLGGNTLLAFGNRNKVVELDPGGKEVWSYSINGAWSAEKMANGNVLVTSNSQSKVVEVDRDGKVVWEYRTPNPLNAKPLPNGNILIAAFTQRKVLEVTREKKVVWQYAAPHYAADAHRLENGNTLVASMNGPVAEITPEGKKVWEYTGMQQIYGCSPVANGNVLIASLRGEVIEVTRENKVVWRHKEQNAADAFRLPNGNTLITGSRRFVEVTPAGKEVWKLDGCQYGTARR